MSFLISELDLQEKNARYHGGSYFFICIFMYSIAYFFTYSFIYLFMSLFIIGETYIIELKKKTRIFHTTNYKQTT